MNDTIRSILNNKDLYINVFSNVNDTISQSLAISLVHSINYFNTDMYQIDVCANKLQSLIRQIYIAVINCNISDISNAYNVLNQYIDSSGIKKAILQLTSIIEISKIIVNIKKYQYNVIRTLYCELIKAKYLYYKILYIHDANLLIDILLKLRSYSILDQYQYIICNNYDDIKYLNYMHFACMSFKLNDICYSGTLDFNKIHPRVINSIITNTNRISVNTVLTFTYDIDIGCNDQDFNLYRSVFFEKYVINSKFIVAIILSRFIALNYSNSATFNDISDIHNTNNDLYDYLNLPYIRVISKSTINDNGILIYNKDNIIKRLLYENITTIGMKFSKYEKMNIRINNELSKIYQNILLYKG